MRVSRLMVAAVFIPAAAMAQTAPPATVADKARLEAMESNVASIGVGAEKDRWSANLAMWKVVLAKSGKLSAADIQSLATSLQTVRANVANIPRSVERERWQANVRLWQAFIHGRFAQTGGVAAEMPCAASGAMQMPGMANGMSMPMSGARLATDAAFGRMKLNVARISEAREKERWSANADLWEAVLASTP